MGHNAAEAIIKERENGGRYEDLFDVFRRIDSKDFNRKSVESLARAGAFDCVTERNQLLTNVDKLLEFSRALHRKMDVGQQGLFGEGAVELAAPRITLIEAEKASKDARLSWEKELLGLYLSEHPLSELQQDLQTVATPLNEVDSSFVGQKSMRVAGVVTRITKIMTKSQQAMMFVQLEDMLGKVEILVFPKLLETTQDIWEDGAKVLVEGKLSDKDGEAKILADSVWIITKESLKELKKSLKLLGCARSLVKNIESARRLAVFLHSSLTREQLRQVKSILDRYKVSSGGVAVELHIPQNGSTKTVAATWHVPRQQIVIDALTKVVGTRSLKYL